MRVRFGPFVLDREKRQLLKDGAACALEPKGFELLDLLISRRPAAVSKQDIRDRLWPKTFVSESTLSALVAQVRRGLETTEGTPAWVRTVHGFGYAFDAEAVEEGTSRPSPVVARLAWEGGECALVDGENVIGRGEEVGARIDVPGVSRHHARIVARSGLFMLEDLGSKNGTFVGTRRLTEPTPLADRDEFRLGRTSVVFRLIATSTVTEG
jgi:DNA-binding winged helix-turn-helix (wHTH) protein